MAQILNSTLRDFGNAIAIIYSKTRSDILFEYRKFTNISGCLLDIEATSVNEIKMSYIKEGKCNFWIGQLITKSLFLS